MKGSMTASYRHVARLRTTLPSAARRLKIRRKAAALVVRNPQMARRVVISDCFKDVTY